jgi:hypothetical protein
MDLEEAKCGYFTKLTAANKGQMYGNLEKDECCHFTKLTAAKKRAK